MLSEKERKYIKYKMPEYTRNIKYLSKYVVDRIRHMILRKHGVSLSLYIENQRLADELEYELNQPLPHEDEEPHACKWNRNIVLRID